MASGFSRNATLTVGATGSSGVTFGSTTAIGGDGLEVVNSDGTEQTVSIVNNTWGPVNSIGSRGIYVDQRGGSLNLTINENDIDRTADTRILLDFQDGASGEVDMNNNDISQVVPPALSEFVDGLRVGINGGGTDNCSLCPTGTVNLSMTGNMIRINSDGGNATFLNLRDTSVGNFTVTGNTFDNSGSLGAMDFGATIDDANSEICLDVRDNSAVGEGSFNLTNLFGGMSNLYHATEAGAVAAADIAGANTVGRGGFPMDISFTNTACPVPTVP